jgi:hypothetical protein
LIIDLLFFGIPLTVALCLAAVAVRDEEAKYWPPAISTFAYCAFYMVGGRDVIFYLGGSLLKCSFLL